MDEGAGIFGQWLSKLFSSLFGGAGGTTGNDASGGNWFTQFLSMLFGDNTGNTLAASSGTPSADHPSWFSRTAGALSDGWHAVEKKTTELYHNATGFFSKHGDQLAREVENKNVSLYVQASQVVDGKGALGDMVLIDAQGHKETFHFKSGPHQNGALPGLLNANNLSHANCPADNAPVTSYTLGSASHDTSNYHYDTTNKDTGFFIPLSNDALHGRDGFGIHPNRSNANGSQVGTLGCIGLDDESAQRFDAIVKELEARGVKIDKLDVFAAGQDADKIELARMSGAKSADKTRAS